MRMYPPVWILPRLAQAEDEIGGYHVPAGADVVICPYLMHRHPGFFCVGNNLGMMEAVLVLATVARELRLVRQPGYRVRPEPMLSLRIKGGLPMTIHPVN